VRKNLLYNFKMGISRARPDIWHISAKNALYHRIWLCKFGANLDVTNTLLDTGVLPLFYNGEVETAIELVNACVRGGASRPACRR
jgi:hypothetical protein